jgi:hypothetical protein
VVWGYPELAPQSGCSDEDDQNGTCSSYKGGALGHLHPAFASGCSPSVGTNNALLPLVAVARNIASLCELRSRQVKEPYRYRCTNNHSLFLADSLVQLSALYFIAPALGTGIDVILRRACAPTMSTQGDHRN